MTHGGKRQGAGRKAGAPNKATAERQAEVAASGVTPLEYMLTVLRDDNADKADRMWAAEKAAPFVHPKLAAVEHSGKLETDNTHHGEVAVRPFAEFIEQSLGPGAASVSGGVGTN